MDDWGMDDKWRIGVSKEDAENRIGYIGSAE